MAALLPLKISTATLDQAASLLLLCNGISLFFFSESSGHYCSRTSGICPTSSESSGYYCAVQHFIVWFRTLLSLHNNSLDIGTDAQSAILETEDLAQHGFEQDEITSLLRLREWYQNGGSDRIDVIRYLEFLKFLVSNDKLQP